MGNKARIVIDGMSKDAQIKTLTEENETLKTRVWKLETALINKNIAIPKEETEGTEAKEATQG